MKQEQIIRTFSRGEKIERKKCDVAAEKQRLLDLGYELEPDFGNILYKKEGPRSFEWARNFCASQGTSLPIPRSGRLMNENFDLKIFEIQRNFP